MGELRDSQAAWSPADMSGFDVVKGMAKNSLSSAMQFGEDLAAPFIAMGFAKECSATSRSGPGSSDSGRAGLREIPARSIGGFHSTGPMRAAREKSCKPSLAADPFGVALQMISTVLDGRRGLGGSRTGRGCEARRGHVEVRRRPTSEPRATIGTWTRPARTSKRRLGRIGPGRDAMEPRQLSPIGSDRAKSPWDRLTGTEAGKPRESYARVFHGTGSLRSR